VQHANHSATEPPTVGCGLKTSVEGEGKCPVTQLRSIGPSRRTHLLLRRSACYETIESIDRHGVRAGGGTWGAPQPPTPRTTQPECVPEHASTVGRTWLSCQHRYRCPVVSPWTSRWPSARAFVVSVTSTHRVVCRQNNRVDGLRDRSAEHAAFR